MTTNLATDRHRRNAARCRSPPARSPNVHSPKRPSLPSTRSRALLSAKLGHSVAMFVQLVMQEVIERADLDLQVNAPTWTCR